MGQGIHTGQDLYTPEPGKIQECCLFLHSRSDKFDAVFNEMKELCKASPVETLGVSGKALKDDRAEFVKNPVDII